MGDDIGAGRRASAGPIPRPNNRRPRTRCRYKVMRGGRMTLWLPSCLAGWSTSRSFWPARWRDGQVDGGRGGWPASADAGSSCRVQRMAAAASAKLPTSASPSSSLMGAAVCCISTVPSSGTPQSTRATEVRSSWDDSLDSSVW